MTRCMILNRPQAVMGASIIILLSLIFEWSYVEAFIFYKQPTTHIRCGTSSKSNRRTHHIITTQLRSTTADAGKTNKPRKIKRSGSKSSNKSSSKRGVKATSRSVAITALANAASSAYVSCSSSGAGAQVNAGSFATRQLEQDNNYKQLEGRDRSFARLLVATVERRLGQIDGVLDACCSKYPKGKHRHLAQATLRAGAAQLLFLKTPTFAVVKETVEVLRIHHKLTNSSPVPEPIIKFVNGVLRKLSATVLSQDEGEVLYALQLLDEKTSPRDNIAPWLVNKWEEDWGIETTKLICEEIMPRDERSITPHIDLTAKYSAAGLNEDNEDIHTLIKNLGNNARLLPQGSIRVGSGGDITTWHDFDKGTWWVQDASATLPALVLSKALHDKHSDISNLRVVDMCSAPGGKTSQLLSAGFEHVTAIEANARRSRRLKENLERLRFEKHKYEIVVEEGQKWIPSNNIDGILVDVPCSATGTGKKRPDVLRRESDIAELLNIQEVLATHCAEILPQEGIMVYATCSLLKEESEAQVKKLVEKNLVKTLKITPDEVPGFEDAIDENGWVRVIPGVLNGELRSADGFFLARLVKV